MIIRSILWQSRNRYITRARRAAIRPFRKTLVWMRGAQLSILEFERGTASARRDEPHQHPTEPRHEIRDIFRWIRVRHNTGWHVTIRVAWLASVGDRAICPRPLLRAIIPSVSRAWVVGLKLAPSPARAYRRSQGVEHAYDPGGLGEP